MTRQELNLATGELSDLPDLPIPPFNPATVALSARQLRLGLVRNGGSLAAVQAAIDGISNQQEREEAQIYWEFSTEVNWAHPMTQALMGMVGISPEQGAAMWEQALEYER